jgi:hypothetical protein
MPDLWGYGRGWIPYHNLVHKGESSKEGDAQALRFTRGGILLIFRTGLATAVALEG